MRVANKTRACAAVVMTAITLGTVGCGQGDSGNTGSSGGDAAGIDVAGAQAFVDEHSAAPQGLGLTQPLSKKPPTGKYMISLETPQQVAVEKDDAIAEAAGLLGWKYERIQLGTDAEAAPRAFAAALERHPDIIHYSGTPAAAVQPQLQAAEAQGVVAISDSNTDEVQPPLISTSLDSRKQVEAWGEMSAATVVATSGKRTDVALVSIEAYPSLVAYTDKFVETMKKYCSSCKVEVVNQQISDLGKTTPGAVVSAVQRNPDIGWVVFSFGDLALGVPAALRAAGLQDQVKVGGETPSETNLEALRKGDEAFWTAFPTSILGWRVVDMSARYFVGDDLTPANEALLPTQILTPDNIGDALFEKGIYVGVPNYKNEFKKLWLIG
jgi:ribose transport system substrate-binding protein